MTTGKDSAYGKDASRLGMPAYAELICSLTVTTLPRRRRQAGMFTENFAEIADIIEAAFHCYFGQRQGVADEQLFRGPHPLAVQRFSERQPKT